MPLYEYLCKSCGRRFELLQSMGASSEGIACPQCGDDKAEKQFSTFSGTSSGASESGFSALGGGCGSGGFT